MNIKDIDNKSKVLTNINKMSNTLSMISFSKLNKNYKFLVNVSKLYNKLKIILSYFKIIKKNKKKCLIVISTNKGLCGSINTEIIRNTLNFIKKFTQIDLFIIGKKGIDFFNKKNFFIIKNFLFNDNININNILLKNEDLNLLFSYNNIYIISSKIQYEKIKIIITKLFENYNYKYINKSKVDTTLLIKFYINYTFKYLYLQNIYCEHKSRMILMRSASENSKKIIKNMKLLKNKLRQLKVTTEMLEIINGSIL